MAGYATCTLNHVALDKALLEFYDGTLGPYWSPRRKLVDLEYVGMEPGEPFVDVRRLSVPMLKPMPLDAFIGYLTTWSAYQTWKKAHPTAPDVLTALRAEYVTRLLAHTMECCCVFLSDSFDRMAFLFAA